MLFRSLDYLVGLARECAFDVALRINSAANTFRRASGRSVGQPWNPIVQDFSTFLEAARQSAPGRFDQYYSQVQEEGEKALRDGKISHAEATRRIVDGIFQFIGTSQPTVVIGLVPPYYPSVSYDDRPDFSSFVTELADRLDQFSATSFGQKYDLEAYFTGISDLSYSSLGPTAAYDLEAIITRQMPLYGAS